MLVIGIIVQTKFVHYGRLTNPNNAMFISTAYRTYCRLNPSPAPKLNYDINDDIVEALLSAEKNARLCWCEYDLTRRL